MTVGIGREVAFDNPVAAVTHRRYADSHGRLTAVVAAADTDTGLTRTGYLRNRALGNRTGHTRVGFLTYLVDVVLQLGTQTNQLIHICRVCTVFTRSHIGNALAAVVQTDRRQFDLVVRIVFSRCSDGYAIVVDHGIACGQTVFVQRNFIADFHAVVIHHSIACFEGIGIHCLHANLVS